MALFIWIISPITVAQPPVKKRLLSAPGWYVQEIICGQILITSNKKPTPPSEESLDGMCTGIYEPDASICINN